VAVIDPQRCLGCGICEQVCRFDAVLHPSRGGSDLAYTIDPIGCEGCAACVYQCTEDAIHMQPQTAGKWYRSESRYGALFHADLYPAQENSGKLVTVVKQNARLLAIDMDCQGMIVDGPPGIGCPVISAAAGAHLALIVTEPSAAGIHDLERVLQTTTHFRIPALVVINKADIYPQGAAEIEAVCSGLSVDIIGRIPFDPAITEAMLNAEPVTVFRPESAASLALIAAWQTVATRLDGTGGRP
jgi:MinD superfamily P-loop ATPase